MSRTRFAAALLLVSTLATGTYAVAQIIVPVASTGLEAMPLSSLLDKLAAQGYRDARSIERKSDKLVEVEATGPDGRRMELDVDARSGEVLRAKRD